MKIKEIAAVIEELAPLRWQESYDNAGLVVGRMEQEVTKALIAVDVTDAVLDEAEREERLADGGLVGVDLELGEDCIYPHIVPALEKAKELVKK